MKIRKMLIELDAKTGFYFSTYTGDDGEDKYDMRLYKIKSRSTRDDVRYEIAEPPAGLIKPLEAFIAGLIKEQ
ncbi:MAG: hypothetical protein IJP68_05830 [Selenomonadaceae bacterium]|nr:hypothetical protein [Selenomonadaceae bacterium]